MPETDPVEPVMPKGEVKPGVTITGRTAQLRVSGRVAATLGEWTIVGTVASWECDAVLLERDDDRMRDGATFELRAPFGSSIVRWKGVIVEMLADDRCRISGSGEPERY